MTDTRRIEYEIMLLERHRDRGALGEPPRRLDRSAYVLLSRLELDGPLSIGQLVDALGLDTSTLNRQTSALSRTGLVNRIPDPDGGIARKFRITPQGRRRLHSDRDAAIGGLDTALADWTPGQVRTLAESLRRLNEDIERAAGRPWPRTADPST